MKRVDISPARLVSRGERNRLGHGGLGDARTLRQVVIERPIVQISFGAGGEVNLKALQVG